MQVDRIFDALASRPRREILAYLSKTQLTTSELAQRFAERSFRDALVAAPDSAAVVALFQN